MKEFYVVCETINGGSRDALCMVIKESADVLQHLQSVRGLVSATIFADQAAAMQQMRNAKKPYYHVNYYDPVSGHSWHKTRATLADAINLAEESDGAYITAFDDHMTEWEKCCICGGWHVSGDYPAELAYLNNYCDRCAADRFQLEMEAMK
jgi:hypothetical protein